MFAFSSYNENHKVTHSLKSMRRLWYHFKHPGRRTRLYTLYTMIRAAFRWCMIHKYVPLSAYHFQASTGHRPKSQAPFRPDFVARIDFVLILQEVQPQDEALNLRKCSERWTAWTAKLNNQDYRLNWQAAKHEAPLGQQTVDGKLQSVLIASYSFYSLPCLLALEVFVFEFCWDAQTLYTVNIVIPFQISEEQKLDSKPS